MPIDSLVRELFTEICRIPLIDPHSHINPYQPAARTLDDILGYHYYTELAHSAGMDQGPLAAHVDPFERVKTILTYLERCDNTAQYAWFLEIARTFLGFQAERVTTGDADFLWESAERLMNQPDWDIEVLRRSNIEQVFLTNEFDDNLSGFDTARYVPCLRTDTLVFSIASRAVRERLAKATGVEVGDAVTLRQALHRLFEHFVSHGAKACAISLPPEFSPWQLKAKSACYMLDFSKPKPAHLQANYVFWMLAELCREFNLPFDLMIGVNRRVYENGVYQGQDLFDQRTSLIQYAELFNAFPEVTFCISVLSSGQNQELVSYSWIFPNVVTSGHWWYSNIPAYIEVDLRARLQAVPKTKQIGYYSDMYKLEFGLPKFNMYRRLLARILADDYVRPGILSEAGAVDLARYLLRENVQRIFQVEEKTQPRP
jgi:glucuronate isomerase